MKIDWKYVGVFALAAVAASFLYYYKFLNNFFVDDDFKYLENMFHGPLAVLLGYGTIRVVSNTVWWPLYALSGLDPFGYNLFGVVMHAVDSVLLCIFLMRLTGDKILAAICGGIFVLNSVGCDALFWKAASNTLINVFFYLITLYLYVVYRQEGSRKHLLLSIASYLVAMFSKEDAASMPFIILLLELTFFDGLRSVKETIMRTVPYAAVIVAYALTNHLVFNVLLNTSAEHIQFFKIRPLHSLLTPWSVFFLRPEGFLKPDNPAIPATIIGIVASFFWVKNRKLLYFGYGWIFLAFLPQSFTSLGHLEPIYIANSISRYMYITSIGSSLVLGAVMVRLREKFSRTVFLCGVVIFFSLFIPLNYGLVQARGVEWQNGNEQTARFLVAIKKIIPVLPPKTNIFIEEPPAGRAFIQQALRAFYGNTDITWISDPIHYVHQPGVNSFLVTCLWGYEGELSLHVRWNDSAGQKHYVSSDF
ncbi:hypothetical protein F6V30_15120 [Oryzomonas sagensis]|uniref:Glycosyltransferase RgtA/B/C/D-like domain-containing protein n=1 Tax=Oryzomonas sagensis TaxID=2603857 RepID=A0ABQ6TLL0_9BACT|nr:hypothetical protein [Oryzomonas sagensis]KAB0668835.1 hypothetical protein F6V30_15120 [Oryzomonas sagensis]